MKYISLGGGADLTHCLLKPFDLIIQFPAPDCDLILIQLFINFNFDFHTLIINKKPPDVNILTPSGYSHNVRSELSDHKIYALVHHILIACFCKFSADVFNAS